MDVLRDKILVMLVGPSAIGKSTIMNQVVEMDQQFSRVRSFTTRPPRSNDEPDQYIYIQPDELAKLSTTDEVVSQVTFPTTGQTYGTVTSSYPNIYNLLDTLANSVATYQQLPFKSATAISLTTTADQWRQWFLSRYPEPSEEAEKRLQEAKLSIDWSLSQDRNHHWVINNQSTVQVAQKLIDITVSGAVGDSGTPHAYAILETIERGAVWQDPK